MKEISLQNLSAFEFHCSDSLTDRILEQVKSLEWIVNSNNVSSKTDLFYDEELYDWFDECIFKTQLEIGIPSTIKLPIISCWANKTTKLHNHHLHYHPNSFMSGILYLSSHNTSGETIFTIPHPWMNNFQYIQIPGKENLGTMFRKPASKSTLLLFPSHVKHYVSGLTDKVRYSISFNTFFSGIIAGNEDRKTRLELITKSVKDHYNET
jgi:hypothetical protein